MTGLGCFYDRFVEFELVNFVPGLIQVTVPERRSQISHGLFFFVERLSEDLLCLALIFATFQGLS